MARLSKLIASKNTRINQCYSKSQTDEHELTVSNIRIK